MGFFGGSFGRGLVTGLAEGATRSIQTALDKRNEEITSARKYLRTRRDQLADRAEKYDIRAKKAFDRLANETGSAARGLALFKHLGDIDVVEQFIKDVDDTRRAQPGKPGEPAFNMSAALDWVEGNPMPDITREDAFNAIRYEYKDPSVEFTDTSGLEKIGLGLSEERGQQLISSSVAAGRKVGFTRKPIEGLQKVSINRKLLQPAIDHAYEQSVRDLNLRTKEKSLEEVTERDYLAAQLAISNLDPSSPTYEKDKEKLQGTASALLKGIQNVANAKDTSGERSTVSTENLLLKVYTREKEDAYARNGIDIKNGTYKDPTTKRTVFAAADTTGGFAKAVAAADAEAGRIFVNNQRRSDGTFDSATQQMMRRNGLLGFVTTQSTDADVKTETADAVPEVQTPSKTQTELDDIARTQYPTPEKYLMENMLSKVPSGKILKTEDLGSLGQELIRLYGIDNQTAQLLLENFQQIHNNKTEQLQSQKQDEPFKFVPKEKRVEEERRKNTPDITAFDVGGA